jgi:flagellar FliL protein
MATAKAAPQEEKAAAPAARGMMQRKGLIVAVAGMVVLMLAAGIGSYFIFRAKPEAHAAGTETGGGADAAASGQAAPTEKKAPAQYLDLQPSFVVNLQDDQAMRYLQVDVQLMTRDPKAIEEIKNNIPRIRNTLLLLFSQQHAKDLVTREAKEALEKQALDQVQAVMRDETGEPAVEALYFTSFVMQ